MVYSSRFLRLEEQFMSGPDVKWLQTLLAIVDNRPLDHHGEYDHHTYNDVVNYQNSHYIPADGVVDPQTWHSLHNDYHNHYYEDAISQPQIEIKANSQAKPAITIDTDRSKLYYTSPDKQLVFPIGIGKVQTPSPLGHWTVMDKVSEPGGAFGSRWMLLSVPWGGYGIQGTDNPQTIGKAIGHGCIRMNNPDINELYEITPLGTPVAIIGKTNTGRVLIKGSRGQDVRVVQRLLKSLGYYLNSVDGIYSNRTEQAVKDFQNASAITADGIVGDSTYTAMQKAMDIKNGDVES